jgi:hypothetical protein
LGITVPTQQQLPYQHLRTRRINVGNNSTDATTTAVSASVNPPHRRRE